MAIETGARRVYPPADAPYFKDFDGTEIKIMVEQDLQFLLITEFTICERSRVDGNWYAAMTQGIEGSNDTDAVLGHILRSLNLLPVVQEESDWDLGIRAKLWREGRSELDAARAVFPWFQTAAMEQVNYELNVEYPVMPGAENQPPNTGAAPSASTVALLAFLFGGGRVTIVRDPQTKKLVAKATAP